MTTLRNDYNGLALRHSPMVFRSLELARSFAGACVKTHWIVMGEVGEYLIVCPADFSRLLRAGYEAA